MATIKKTASSSNLSKPMAEMVKSAIEHHSDERLGPSLAAIKKFLIEHYNVDMKKKAHLLRRHLETSVAKGYLVQTKGIGINGRFKLAKIKDSKSKLAMTKVKNDHDLDSESTSTSKKIKSTASKPIVQAQKSMVIVKEKKEPMNKKKASLIKKK
ncbi:Histone H1-like [Dermatophagoides farinae]|uniref:Histone H1-like n=1 Tax=Dermatophagoides farinae TaxID=6954 RepID=A0A922IEK8_DERFA|nr:histone H1-like [Dermatophagoides farinae]KAH7641926.1 hypothetical protein HUG17_4971 [Dermatophagoides farinae]KAH9529011.1 Histone H1-like [Dermatophagoides farinae]